MNSFMSSFRTEILRNSSCTTPKVYLLLFECITNLISPAVNAILALSARHLSLSRTANEEQGDRSIGLKYYYETLHYLQKAMSYDSYTTSLELLATTLIVSTYEMLDDIGSGWERHLKGVFWIQRSQVIQGESGGLRSAVWWAWLRQDVWAAFRERRKTLSFWTPTKAYKMLTPHEIALRSIWIFARAVDYCSLEEIKNGELDLQPRIEKAKMVLEMLDEWDRNLTIEFMPLPVDGRLGQEGFKPIWINPPAFGRLPICYWLTIANSVRCRYTAELCCSNSTSSTQAFPWRPSRLHRTTTALIKVHSYHLRHCYDFDR